MTPRILSVVGGIRRKLELQAESWQLGAPGAEVTEDDDVSHLSGTAGEGGADNVSQAQDQMDMYLSDIADTISQTYGGSFEDALDFLYSVADEMEEQDMLPPLPDDDADDEETGLWLGTAESIGFGQHVLSLAHDQLSGQE